MVRLALYQPEIAQNAGTLMRLSACMGIPMDIIEPCGFIWDDKKLKRSGMDYLDIVNVTRHRSWETFCHNSQNRLVLIDVQGEIDYTSFNFQENDVLMLGRESSGVPSEVFEQCRLRVHIPQTPQCRSLNVAVAGAMVLGEALRQLNAFPKEGK